MIAVCSACKSLNAAELECECTSSFRADKDAVKKFRRTFPRKEYMVSELVKAKEEAIEAQWARFCDMWVNVGLAVAYVEAMADFANRLSVPMLGTAITKPAAFKIIGNDLGYKTNEPM